MASGRTQRVASPSRQRGSAMRGRMQDATVKGRRRSESSETERSRRLYEQSMAGRSNVKTSQKGSTPSVRKRLRKRLHSGTTRMESGTPNHSPTAVRKRTRGRTQRNASLTNQTEKC